MQPRALIARSDGWTEYREPVDLLIAGHPRQAQAVIREAERRARSEGLHAVGFVSYEAAPGLDPALSTHPRGLLPPAWFALYPGPAPHRPLAIRPMQRLNWQPDLDADTYAAVIGRIREWIAAGDSYQVNFSYRLQADVGDTSGAPPDSEQPLGERLLATMLEDGATPLSALIETDDWAICSASPELFFSRRGRRLCSRPMKGTVPRGETPDADVRLAEWLRHSPKNRAENLMITDMVRNDLARVAAMGSVRTRALFELEPYPNVWQLTSTVEADCDADLAEVFRALFPAASITGAPKRRAMEIIRALEAGPREIYTGAIGWVAPDGDAQFNVAIRTALVDKRRRRAEYGVGGGIVWDSEAAEEYAETVAKARILLRRPTDQDAFKLLETLLWTPDRGCTLVNAHLERLIRSAGFFCRPVDRAAAVTALQEATADLPAVPHRVRLLVDGCGRPTVSTQPLDASPAPQRLAIARCRLPLAGNPFVLHKTTRRDVYDMARQEAAAAGADDVLLVNLDGDVTESTIANVVVDVGGTLVTPPVDVGLLPGVYRAELLDAGTVVEGRLTPDDVRRAGAVFLANSVRGLWPVTLV